MKRRDFVQVALVGAGAAALGCDAPLVPSDAATDSRVDAVGTRDAGPSGLPMEFQQLLVPVANDYQLRQPVPTSSVRIVSVPASGSVHHVASGAETVTSAGAMLSPIEFKSLFHRPPSGARPGEGGALVYEADGVTKSLTLMLTEWQAMHAIQKARIRIFDAATGGTQLFEAVANFNLVPIDPLMRVMSGPLPSAVEGIGYQYCAMTAPIPITAPASKMGFSVVGYRWWTPANGTLETHFECWPNAAGRWPLRTDQDSTLLGPEDRSLVNVEVDLLTADDALYTGNGDRPGKLRGTTNGMDETRIRLTAGTGAWWWNRVAPLRNVTNHPRLLYPHRMGPTHDLLGHYSNSNTQVGASYQEAPKYPSDGDIAHPHFGYCGPGDNGMLTRDLGAGGQTHDRQPYHEAESAVLQWGPDHMRRVTIQGAHSFGEIMREVADCACNGMIHQVKMQPGGGPLDYRRLGESYKNVYVSNGAQYGQPAYYAPSSSPFSGGHPGAVDLQLGVPHNGWGLDQAHYYTACGAAYELTGSVRYFFMLQYGPIVAILGTNPALRDGLAIQGQVPYSRAWVKPVLELFKAANAAPAYEDAMYLNAEQLHGYVEAAWSANDAYHAEEETSTHPGVRAAWNLGLRRDAPSRSSVGIIQQDTNPFAESVRPVNYGVMQGNWPSKNTGDVVFGWVHGVWDVCYVNSHLLLLKKMGRFSRSQHRMIRKLLRFTIGVGTKCRQGAERHPFVLVDRTSGAGAPIDWTSYDDGMNPFDSQAVPGTAGSAALGGVEWTSWDQVRMRRGEPDDAATATVDQNASRNFAFYLYWQFLEIIEREFPEFKTESEFAADFPRALAFFRRNMGYIQTALLTCERIYNPASDPTFRLTGRDDLSVDSNVNRVEGAYFLPIGEMFLSTSTSLENPHVWSPSGVDA